MAMAVIVTASVARVTSWSGQQQLPYLQGVASWEWRPYLMALSETVIRIPELK